MTDTDNFFNDRGRCIPSRYARPVHNESRSYFTIQTPKIDHEYIYNKIKNFLDPTTNLSLEDFKKRSFNIIDKLSKDVKLKNIIKGAGVPFFLPKRKDTDIGKELSEKYLIGLNQSFKDENPNYDFVNHCQDNLNGLVAINTKSRHEKLIKQMETEIIVGYYFPAMLEYSFPAAFETLSALPENFYLAGGFDTCAAFIGYPNLLLNKKNYPPLLWLSALNDEKENIGYHIEAYGYNLTFNKRPHLGNVAEYWGHALIVL